MAVAADTDGIAADALDFDAVQGVFKARDIAAIALARDFDVMDAVIEFDADRNRKGRRQRPAARAMAAHRDR